LILLVSTELEVVCLRKFAELGILFRYYYFSSSYLANIAAVEGCFADCGGESLIEEGLLNGLDAN